MGAPRLMFQPIPAAGESQGVVDGGRLSIAMFGEGEEVPLGTHEATIVLATAFIEKARGATDLVHTEYARLNCQLFTSNDTVRIQLIEASQFVYSDEDPGTAVADAKFDPLPWLLRVEYDERDFAGIANAPQLAELRLPRVPVKARYAELAVALLIGEETVSPARLNDILDIPLVPNNGECIVNVGFDKSGEGALPITLAFESHDGSVVFEELARPEDADTDGVVVKRFAPLDRRLRYSLYGTDESGTRAVIFENIAYHKLGVPSDQDENAGATPDDSSQATEEETITFDDDAPGELA